MSDFYSNQPYRERTFMLKPEPELDEQPHTDSLPETAVLTELEARLTGQIRELETRLIGELSTLRTGCGTLWDRLAAVEGEFRIALPQIQTAQQAEAERRDLFREVWEGAALTVRLAFEQVALAREHPLQAALREAAALVDLWRKGAELESWVAGYPVLFLEAWEKLSPPGAVGFGAVELLSRETLAEVQTLLTDTLRARGIEWVAPRPGEPVTEAHTVLGEDTVPGVTAGKVARCGRPGLRRGGTLLLPAQVFRQAVGATAPELPPAASEPTVSEPIQQEKPVVVAEQTSAPVTPVTLSDPPPANPVVSPLVTTLESDRPEWLGELERRSAGQTGPHSPVTEALRLLSTPQALGLSDAALCSVLSPLLPALGPARGVLLEGAPEPWREAWETALPGLPAWLAQRAGLEIVAPEERAPFVPERMEATESRRTAHPHEANTVARLEQVGMLREGRVLFPARVIRYETGVNW